MKVKFLNMIGHGTNGSDGIEPGNHLRWAFNDKLGFPSCFQLYRRETALENIHYLRLDNNMTLDLPYQQSDQDFTFTLSSAIMDGLQVSSLSTETITLPNGNILNVIALDGELHFSFSEPISRVELKLVIDAQADYEITAGIDGGEYRPQPVLGTATGAGMITFDAPGTTSLVLSGNGIAISQLCAIVCGKGKKWDLIKLDCGCGLPVNQQKTKYILEKYPAMMGNDLATVLCRLGVMTLDDTNFALTDFLNLKTLLLSMLPEGLLVPWGWTLFPSTPGSSAPQEGDAQFELSKYDFLLAQSLHVFYAKILDLYFVDTQVDADVYYDYRVTATWPETNMRRLGHEITFEEFENGQTFFPVSSLDENGVLIASQRPEVVVEDHSSARTGQGLLVTTGTGLTAIDFISPVTEVQLWLVNRSFNDGQAEIIVEAYTNYLSAPVDLQKLTLGQGLVRVRAGKMNSLKLRGSNFVISRLSYDFDPYPVGVQEYILCGVKKDNHYPLEMPTGLLVSLIPGGVVNASDGNVVEKPYVVGLRWDANEDPLADLLSIAPLMYKIQRKTKNGPVEDLTQGSPVFIAPTVIGETERNIPAGWPQERQYYLDGLLEKVKYSYRIAAQDLFGRTSRFTNYASYLKQQSAPAHPIQVSAQFLDYATYDNVTDTFSDGTLNTDDKNWLRSNQVNALVVRWNWSADLQSQFPDVDGFNIFYKKGWLNSYSGIITGDYEEKSLTLVLTRAELAKFPVFRTSPATVTAYKFKTSIHLDESVKVDHFRLCWLSQGANRFLVLKNTAGKKPTVWVLDQHTVVDYRPVKDHGFGVAVTPSNAHFIDYLDAGNWTDTSITHLEPKDGAREIYTVYLKDPAFPQPPFQTADRDKVRYGQIAVNSQIGALQGSVSQAATVMAIYRSRPAPPRAFLPAASGLAALKATPANVYGKSTFALRWGKTHSPLKHHVFRTLDSTLYSVDNANRQSRDDAIYARFKTDYPEFSPVDVDAVQQIGWQADIKLVATGYSGLTPAQLQILASLPDNAGAFTQVTAAAIDENDAAFEDRVTEIPLPPNGPAYTPDPTNILLYIDETLDGRSTNRFFYALKTLDTNGLASELSLATLPVECPRTTPPPRPVISSITAGEKQITIAWAKNPGVEIAGYLVYRTQEKTYASDWRKMQMIRANPDDVFSVTVNGSLPPGEFEFRDTSVVPRQAYFYGVVAVGLSDDGKQLKSNLSAARTGQAWDGSRPDITNTVLLFEINYQREHIDLAWVEATPDFTCELSRSPGWNDSLTRWMTFDTGGSRYEFRDTEVDLAEGYQYQLTVRTSNGQEADVRVQAQVIP